jgi:RNA-directed DNA polymerase
VLRMKESYGEGLATHTGPESCAAVREALTGVRAGRVFSRERKLLRDADAVEEGGRPHPERRHRKTLRSPARSETSCMPGHTSRENRESPWSPVVDGTAGRVGKSKDARR